VLPLLRERFQSFCNQLSGNAKTPRQFSYLGVVGPLWEHFATFLVFADQEKAPLFRVKIARDARGDEQLLAEQRIIRSLSSAELPSIAAAMPVLLMSEEVHGQRVSVETAMNALPLAVRLGSEHPSLRPFAEALQATTSWLGEFHLATKGLPQLRERSGSELAVNALARFRESFMLSSPGLSFVSELMEVYSDPERSWGASFAHGDFRGRNVLGSGEDLTVVNWYLAAPRPPLHDFFTLLLAGDESERRDDPERLRGRMNVKLLEKTPYSQVTWRSLTSLCRVQDLPLASVWPCLGLFLVNSALWQREISREALDVGLRRRQGEETWVMAFEHLARAGRPPHNGTDLSDEVFFDNVGNGSRTATEAEPATLSERSR
jgi:hypothetical protein